MNKEDFLKICATLVNPEVILSNTPQGHVIYLTDDSGTEIVIDSTKKTLHEATNKNNSRVMNWGRVRMFETYGVWIEEI